MPTAIESRFRLEPLRRFASAVLAASGLDAPRASAFAGQLLWFDAIGALNFGMSTLPGWLDGLDRGAIAAKSLGKVGPERAATAVVDGKDGVGPLILARAGEIAVEKARDVGVGLVRVRGIGPVGSAAAIVAEMAIGPVAAVALGPKDAWSVALPSAEGQPLVADSSLGGGPRPAEAISPWGLVVEDGGWLIQAVSVAALEPLVSLHERVAAATKRGGWCSPETWEAPRREARERGVALGSETVAALRAWAERRHVAEAWPGA